MIPTTPYLIRAIYDWCSDQGFTPHMLVDASVEGVVVPQQLVENDAIVLNIEASAVRSLEMGNEWVMFNARFSGKPMEVIIPVSAVRAIFARENGLGCAFETAAELTPEEAKQALDELNEQDQEDPGHEDQGQDAEKAKPKKGGKKQSHLKLV